MAEKALEKEISSHEKQIAKLQNEIEEMEKTYVDKSHQLFHLNTQIEGLEKALKQRKDQGTDKIKEQIEQEQVVLRKSQEQTDVKLRKTFQNFFTQQKTRMYLQANKSNNKMDVNSVAVFQLMNPHEFVLGQWQDEAADFQDGFTVTYKCVTFLIKKSTTIQQIFDWSVQYWQLSRSEFTMVDRNCNCMELVMNYPAENFFSAHKEQVPYACLYIYRKKLSTNFLLDEQKINIQLPGRSNQQTNQDDENIKLIKKELDDFVDVQPGLKLYEKQETGEENKESGSISIGWKLFLLLLSATLLVLIFFNSKNIMDYETTSQVRLTLHNYFLEVKYGLNTVSTIDDLYKKINLITIVNKVNVTLDNGTVVEEDVISFQFVQMGPKLKVFQVQSSMYDCNEIELLSGLTDCSYSIYSDTNALKDNIVASDGNTYNWGEYKNQPHSGVYPFSGILSKYEGSGFDESYESYEYVDDKVQEHKKQGMFDIYKTKMVLFDVVIYDDSREQFYVIYYFFEIAPSYEIVQQLQIESFRCLTPSTSQNFWLLEYVQLAASGLLNSIMIFVSVKETLNQIRIKHGGFSLTRDAISFVQVGILYQLSIFILQLVSFTMFSSIPSDALSILENSDKPDIMQYGQSFSTALIIRGILIILVGFNTLKLFQISQSVAFVQAMAAKGAENIIMIIIFAITILASYAFIFYQLFNQKFDEFTTYYRSFISTCGMFFLGNYKIWFRVVDYDVQTMIIVTALVFVTYTYGATVLVNAVLQEVYRTISYRTDHLQTIKEFYDKIEEIKQKIRSAISKLLDSIKRKNQ